MLAFILLAKSLPPSLQIQLSFLLSLDNPSPFKDDTSAILTFPQLVL